MTRTRKTATGCALVAAVALVPAAGAAQGDRDGDRLPDSWERQYRLSTSANSARGDADSDRLRNRAEFRFGMDARDRDSDNDGVRDSRENAGVVAAFADGTLEIDLAAGGTLSGIVNEDTRIVVRSASEATGEDRQCERDGGGEAEAAHFRGSREGGRRGGRGEEGDTSDLVVGARVHEAEVDTEDGATVFTYIEIIE
jgi:hypothetical protein